MGSITCDIKRFSSLYSNGEFHFENVKLVRSFYSCEYKTVVITVWNLENLYLAVVIFSFLPHHCHLPSFCHHRSLSFVCIAQLGWRRGMNMICEFGNEMADPLGYRAWLIEESLFCVLCFAFNYIATSSNGYMLYIPLPKWKNDCTPLVNFIYKFQ